MDFAEVRSAGNKRLELVWTLRRVYPQDNLNMLVANSFNYSVPRYISQLMQLERPFSCGCSELVDFDSDFKNRQVGFIRVSNFKNE